MDPGGGRTGVDDRAARLLLTPVLGVIVPNLAGIIDHGHHTAPSLAASYAWFTLVSFITWEGNLRRTCASRTEPPGSPRRGIVFGCSSASFVSSRCPW